MSRSELASLCNMNMLIHEKNPHFCLLCAKSYGWKALMDFKQMRAMIFLTLKDET